MSKTWATGARLTEGTEAPVIHALLLDGAGSITAALLDREATSSSIVVTKSRPML